MEINLACGIVSNFEFLNIHQSKTQIFSVSDCDKYQLKIEISQGPDQLNTVEEEASIIRMLNKKNCQTCPRLMLESAVTGADLIAEFPQQLASSDFINAGSEYSFIITEAFSQMSPVNTADISMAIIEQKKLGVWIGPLNIEDCLQSKKSNTVILNNYEQAILLDKDKIDMPNAAYFNWLDENTRERFAHLGMTSFTYGLNVLTETHFTPLFDGDKFDLARTVLFTSQETTLNPNKIYHSFTTEDIFAKGERTLDNRTSLLDMIEFKPGERVLDVGCNAGLLCHYLSERGCNTWGIDIDQAVITGAQIIANIIGKPDIGFECHDVDNGGPIGFFDTICLFSVIHHTANIVDNAARISKFCNRIIIECRLTENGAKPVGDGNWIGTTVWNHKSKEDLISGLEDLFPNFHHVRTLGQGDRDRYIMELVKE
jgi:2-polyprenyl-3-methyl-5-hydroxy-6-metoxy-1,4-benzoquinol methylase